MRTVRTIEEVRQAVGSVRADGGVVGFVPTMGFLHEGHLTLVDLARQKGADLVVVSIFVNPKQFAPTEDLERYPRDEARDRELLELRGADLLFLPEAQEMYPDDFATTVSVRGVAEPLEGERRPGHFDGVATVVLKLFHIVAPDFAVFGRKDAQQCAVVERMVKDLALPVEIVIGETVREADGLALSSRNAYLSADERKIAPALHQALVRGREMLSAGAAGRQEIEQGMRLVAEQHPPLIVDYLTVVDPSTFLPPADLRRDLLLVGAVRLGSTRLIDNLPVSRHSAETESKEDSES